ncbi:MAG: S9 family peptidase [Opitutales bacterium]
MRFLHILVLVSIVSATGLRSKEIPIENLFSVADFSTPKLSPDGQYLAVLSPDGGWANLFVIDLKTANLSQIVNGPYHVSFMDWVSNDRLVFSFGNDEDSSYELYAIDRDGQNPTHIKRRGRLLSPQYTRDFGSYRDFKVLDYMKEERDLILIADDTRYAMYPDVYQQKLSTGRSKRVLSSPKRNVVEWFTGRNGEVRAGLTRESHADLPFRYGLIYRKSKKANFEIVEGFQSAAPRVKPLGFSEDNETMYVAHSSDGGPSGLFIYDPEKSAVGDVLLNDPRYDVSALRASVYSRKVLGAVIEKEKPEYLWFSESLGQIQSALDQEYPDTVNYISSVSEDETRFVSTSYSGNEPEFYTLLEIENGALTLAPLSKSRPKLEAYEMAPQEPFSFRSRDDILLNGYVYFPVGTEKVDLPLVVMPHDGPEYRDFYGWDPRVQFFVSRGFMVLQVDFRGSAGYGRRFVEAGYGKWGDEMQWDVYDAVQWAIQEGYVDPKKIGIYGSGYGGFTVLSQLTQYPDLYQFGINEAGFADLEFLLKYQKSTTTVGSPVIAFKEWQRWVGDLSQEIEKIRRISPIENLENLDDPLLIIQEKRDLQAIVKQSDRLRKALEKLDKDFLWYSENVNELRFEVGPYAIEKFKRIEEFIRPFREKWDI